jgi:putative phosphonate metabolism protein
MNSERHSTPYRCAVYFVPEVHSDWWQAGSHWLGRCAASGASYAPPDIHGVTPDEFQACTADPRRYGWHATLKAPFTLAKGQSLDALRTAMRELAGSLSAFDLPPLRVSTLGQFLALRPDGDSAHIHTTAAACVTRLHPLAQPLSEAELTRRRQARLTPEQDRLLLEWGYPWVLQYFQFHLSLTGPLDAVSPDVQTALVQAAQARFESLPVCRFSHIALFVEPQAGADFECVEQMALRR